MLVVFPTMVTPLSSKDEAFIIETLGTTAARRDSLTRLLADPELIDIVLDSNELHAAMVERLPRLGVSTQADFYLLIRPALLRVGVEDRRIARYLAALLASFAYAERTPNVLPRETFSLNHLQGMFRTLRDTSEEGRFMLLAYMGNYALLMGGLFPERLACRSHAQGQPDLDYCDKLGRRVSRRRRTSGWPRSTWWRRRSGCFSASSGVCAWRCRIWRSRACSAARRRRGARAWQWLLQSLGRGGCRYPGLHPGL